MMMMLRGGRHKETLVVPPKKASAIAMRLQQPLGKRRMISLMGEGPALPTLSTCPIYRVSQKIILIIFPFTWPKIPLLDANCKRRGE